MECNKEEAIRAKEIAERKMQSNDFISARKFALKAQQLFPELENISQLLAVCEVHCSAENKALGSEKDWYGILQIERVADESTIKKQYRKLALLLHPDKNNFAGAEAAFKLIGEANRVLSDQSKRSVYDLKFRSFVRTSAPKPPSHPVSRNTCVKKTPTPNQQFSGANLQQHTQQGPNSSSETFWTCCPYCFMRYQFYRTVVNRNVRCQTCHKPFAAYETGPQGLQAGSNFSRPAGTHEKAAPNPVAFQPGPQNTGQSPFTVKGFEGNSNNGTVGSESAKAGSSAGDVRGSKTKENKNGNVNMRCQKKGVETFKTDAPKRGESSGSRNDRRKRGRKMVVESSESSESSNDVEESVVIQENGSSDGGQNGGHDRRRSSRLKRNVSYNEHRCDDDDDFLSPLKRSRESESSKASEQTTEAQDGNGSKKDNFTSSASDVDGSKQEVKPKSGSSLEESQLNRKRKADDNRDDGTEAARKDHNDEQTGVNESSKENSDGTPITYEYPDPEFSDFDKIKAEDCFGVDQLWAVYDTVDGMPRFYVRVRKVFSSEFRLRITWLEPDPDDEAEIEWADEGLPFACGKFCYGSSEETVDRLMFSHQVYFEKGKSRSSLVIYPQVGETWALFKSWNINWSSNPEEHKPYRFEFVEILSEFNTDDGIKVAQLKKVKGFVSLFHKTKHNGVFSFQIPPSELLRFSHRIPSLKMTGNEREGVPEGSFELDPASLPAEIDEFVEFSDVKKMNESTDTGVDKPLRSERIRTPKKREKNESELENVKPVSRVKSNNGCMKQSQVNSSPCPNPGTSDKKEAFQEERYGEPSAFRASTSCKSDEGMETPKKHRKKDIQREISALRKSPRNCKRNGEVNVCATQDESDKHSGGSKDDKPELLAQSKERASPCQVNDVGHLDGKVGSPKNSIKNSTAHPFSSSGSKVRIHNFSEDKSQDKFQLGQVWALYTDNDRLPKIYAQVKKIETTPDLKLHVAMLEHSSSPLALNLPVSTGTFTLRNGKPKIVRRSAFSHQLKAKPVGKNKFEIHPRKGEVWAIYKKWNANLTPSDQEKAEYDIVEVLEVNDLGTKVSVLGRVNGFESVYKAPRRQRSNIGVIVIPCEETTRFSHQIPAFRNTGEEDIRLRDCWELDPLSTSGNVICLD